MKTIEVQYGGFKTTQAVNDELFNAIYSKGRIEAIEEFVEKANEEVYKDFNFADVGEYSISDVALTLYRVAEQLKEQKND